MLSHDTTRSSSRQLKITNGFLRMGSLRVVMTSMTVDERPPHHHGARRVHSLARSTHHLIFARHSLDIMSHRIFGGDDGPLS